MAKHKFIKPNSDLSEGDALKSARDEGPMAMAARTRLASMGRDLPGKVKPKSTSARMKKRYGGHLNG